MPARGNITINDRAATPVAHVFTPDGEDANNVHIFREKTGVAVGDPRITVSVNSNPISRGGKTKVQFRLSLPTVQTEVINGISRPSVVRTAHADVTFTYDGYSELQERKNLVGLVQNALASTQTILNPVFTEGEDLW